MSSKPWSTRFALWVAVWALLLKAAVPMLATASAQAQGKALVEVCTVYGVATVALEDAGSQPAPQHGAVHGGDHCALTALMALAAPEPQRPALLVAQPVVLPLPSARPLPQAPDACATWVARLKQGPPVLA